ncbi:MAG: CMP-N,N'-diacetyllegionaminic acid synthase, partial [Planctomycetota bacterium]
QKAIGDFKKVIKYQMDDVSSIDIDTSLDWEFAEFIANKKGV